MDFAIQIRQLMQKTGYPLFIASPTNQQFFTLPNDDMDPLHQHASFELWGPRGETTTTVRFVTSWATTAEDIQTLAHALKEIRQA